MKLLILFQFSRYLFSLQSFRFFFLFKPMIHFLYEPAIFLGGKVVYPDFAVDLYWKQMIGIIERDGMLDDPQYKARKLKDLDRWITYGYYPGINLLILSDHPRFGYDERRTGNLLRAFCLP